MLNGILLFNKPPGLRSRESLNIIKRTLGRGVRLGHAGTLDSTAGGLLIVLIGGATRTSSYIMELPKKYEVTLILGQKTDTDDYDGNVIQKRSFVNVTPQEIDMALMSLQGTRFQTPPDISAIKIKGQRAHRIARKGDQIKISPRTVSIPRIKRVSAIGENGEVSLVINCHKGTYVRSIVRDLGDLLGCGAFVSSLKRTFTGPFSLDDPACLHRIQDLEKPDMVYSGILKLESLLPGFTSYKMDSVQEEMAGNGQKLLLSMLERICFGQVSAAKGVILSGETLFSFSSICLDNLSGSFLLHPQTNIFL